MSAQTKTGAKTGHFQKGDDARRGGGKKGRSGRKPLEFKAECERLTDQHVLPKVEQYLAGAKAKPDDPSWRWCAEYVTRYSKTEPKKAMELTGPNGEALHGPEIHVHLSDNGRGLEPPAHANGNGRHGRGVRA